MSETAEDKFMRRCLDLAARAEGMTYPNPIVGSVIVHEGVIIGEDII
jgi:diaminohydroxyphosphoribosylaminopyrimidine deaminase/5-amino-6-(5-phosphoribosylamino)uracil reductase